MAQSWGRLSSRYTAAQVAVGLLFVYLFFTTLKEPAKAVAVRGSTTQVVFGDESLMSAKAYGTCSKDIQPDLRFGSDRSIAERVCCHNRHYAEEEDYFFGTSWVEEVRAQGSDPIRYFDASSGRMLFSAPVGRSVEKLLEESRAHGWPSFRDEEVNWQNVRVLSDGEVVSIDGTHLGHNIPDAHGNRYCIK